MHIEAACPNAACGKRYSVAETAVGRSVRCKACGATFVVTATADERASPSQTKPSPVRPAVPIELTGVGRFVVRAKLGAGAFGTVYRAYDPQLDREVALKVPKPGTLDSPQRVERFLREAKAAARLRHPHIVPVFDAGSDGDHYYIASAFIDGRPLSDALDETGTDFRRAARLTRELAEALAYAHGEGVVHRDVKPANAMLDAQDRLHLMDFGLAARAEDTGEAKLTKDGAVMGTPAYMSPEQARGQKGEARPATDQYAVGVVLYELLTGEVPFKGPVATVLHNVIHTEPDAPRQRRADVPRDLETVCLKALSKRPEDRYANCQALADDLRRWLDSEPITARRLGPAERVARWARKNPAIATSAAVAFAALVVGTAVSVWQASVASAEAANARSAEGKEVEQRGVAEANERAAKNQEAVAQQALIDLKAETEQKNRALEDRLKANAGREAALRQSLAQARVAGHRFNLLGARDLALKGDYAGARATLASCPFDTRGWEWHYLAGVVQRWEKEKAEKPVFAPRAATAGDLKGAAVLTFRYAPTAKQFVGFCSDGRLRVWDAASGEEKDAFAPEAPVGMLPLFTSAPMGVSPDARVVALPLYVPQKAMRVALWDVGGRKLIRVHQLAEDADPAKVFPAVITYPDAVALEFSPDGRALACAKSSDMMKKEPGGRVVLWEVESGRERHSLVVDNWDAVCLAFSPDGKRLAGGTSNITKSIVLGGGYATAKVHVWDLGAAERPPLTVPLAAGATSVKFSPDGRLIACGDHLERVVVADAATGDSRFVGVGAAAAVEFTPDGSRLVCADVRPKVPTLSPAPERRITLKSWDVATGQEVLELASDCRLECDPKQLPRNVQSPHHLFAIPEATGARVALSDGAGIRTFDAGHVSEPFALERGVNRPGFLLVGPEGQNVKPIHTAAFAPNDAWVALATSTLDDPKRKLNAPRPPVPGGAGVNLFAEGVEVQSVIQVWDAASGRLVTALNGPHDPAIRVAVSPGGEWVAVLTRRATGGAGGPPPRPVPPKGPPGSRFELSLWDVKKQVVVRTWPNLPLRLIRGVGFRSDGSHLSVAGDDGALTWRVADGAAVEGTRFAQVDTEFGKVLKSDTGDVLVMPNAKLAPGMGAALSSDGRRRVRTLDGGAVVVEEIR